LNLVSKKRVIRLKKIIKGGEKYSVTGGKFTHLKEKHG